MIGSGTSETARLGPGSAIGILGGGQLGRMMASAAARLGIRCHVYAPEPDSPAFDVASRHQIGTYDDEAALKQFAAAVDCVTYEFENVPAATVAFLKNRIPVRPGERALHVCQDRLREKELAASLSIATAPYADITSLADLVAAIARLGCPCVLKTRRFGYDGKGQFVIKTPEQAAEAYDAIGGQPAILEGFVSFSKEVSVVAARGLDGSFKAYPVTENEHRDQILRRSMAPARLHPTTVQSAIQAAAAIAAALEYVGVFAVEFFIAGEGKHEHLMVNEIAPRVHNSGHWTQDGAETSQFEQHIRAICGLPLGATSLRAPHVEMVNLIGNDVLQWPELMAEQGCQVHLYGKGEPRPGRKMGHVVRLLRD
jgi:5-(carboxyamino)imidazole ribonucleotide synthase